MHKITLYSDWSYIDQLERKDLEDGEVLRIQWPDKTVEEHKIIVTKSRASRRTSTWPLGHDVDCIDQHAFVHIYYHGSKATIPLIGLMAERVKEEK